jgi:hypothetical protein
MPRKRSGKKLRRKHAKVVAVRQETPRAWLVFTKLMRFIVMQLQQLVH